MTEEELTKQAECCVHEDVIDQVTMDMPPEETLYDLAEFFKVFGDSTRIRILYALFEAELCVGDMAKLLGLSQTACSHQLRVLKNNKLVRFRREGKVVYYSLSDDHVRSIIEKGMEHVEELLFASRFSVFGSGSGLLLRFVQGRAPLKVCFVRATD